MVQFPNSTEKASLFSFVMSLILTICWAEDIYLNASYDDDVTLYELNRYYIDQHNVSVLENATLYIENGVEIIFNGDYSLNIMESIDCGCYDDNTTNIRERGLANDQNNSITISAGTGDVGNGTINIINGKSGKFCNTIFKDIGIGIKFEGRKAEELIIDNCEFINLYAATWIDIPILHYMSDSIIDSVTYINTLSGGIYENCQFSKFEAFFGSIPKIYGNWSQISIVDSNINHTNTEGTSTKTQGINIASLTKVVYKGIYNNMIDNGYYGITISQSNDENDESIIYIGNNTITNNNESGLQIARGNVIIDDNLFVNNGYDIIMEDPNLTTTPLPNINIINNIFTEHNQTSIKGKNGTTFTDLNIINNTFESPSNNLFGLNKRKFMSFISSSQIYVRYNEFINTPWMETGISIINSSDIYIEYNNFFNITLSADDAYLIKTIFCININIDYNTFIGNRFINYGMMGKTDIYRSTDDLNVYFSHNDVINNSIALSMDATWSVLNILSTTTIFIQHNHFENLMEINIQSQLLFIAGMINTNGNISISYNEFIISNISLNAYIRIFSSIVDDPATLVKINYNNFWIIDEFSAINLINSGNPFNVDASLNYFAGLQNLKLIENNLKDRCYSISYGRINISSLFVNPIDFSNPNLYQPCIYNLSPIPCGSNISCSTTSIPTSIPIATTSPTSIPTSIPIATKTPTSIPTSSPTLIPTASPTLIPIANVAPTSITTSIPTKFPNGSPTIPPTIYTTNSTSIPTTPTIYEPTLLPTPSSTIISSTYIPTYIPTKQTISPSIASNPTQTGDIIIYKIEVTLSFGYEINKTDTESIKQIVTDIMNDTIITHNINVNHCVDSESEQFIADSINRENNTFINATTLICDKLSFDVVLISLKKDFYRDLVNNTNKIGLIIKMDEEKDVDIMGDIIYKHQAISSTILLVTESTTINNKDENNIIDTIEILIGIGCALFICVLIICFFYFYKIKKINKEIQESEKQIRLNIDSNTENIDSNNIIDNDDDVNLINTNDITDINDNNDNNDSNDNDDNDDIHIISTEIKVNDKGLNEYKEDDNLEEYDDEKYNISTPNGNNFNKKDMELMEKKLMMKEWLTNIVELEQYYDIFIENGFESIGFIKDIGDKAELIEIGIVLKGHQTRVMAAINKLKKEGNDNNKEEDVDVREEGIESNITKKKTEDIDDKHNYPTPKMMNNEDFEVLGDHQTNDEMID